MSKRTKQSTIYSWNFDKDYKERDKNGNLKPSKRYLILYHSLLSNKTTLKLATNKPNAFKLLIYMFDYSCGQQTFQFPRSVNQKIFNSVRTFDTAVKDLIGYGFIEIIEKGGFIGGLCVPTTFRFSDKWHN